MRSLTTFPALFLLLLMAVTPVSIAWSADRPDTGSDPPSQPTADGGDATVLSTTVLQPSSDGVEVVTDSPPAVNGDASSPYPDGKSGDGVTDDPSTDQQLSNSDVASPASSEDAETEETEEASSALPLNAASAVEPPSTDLPENEDVPSSTSPVDDSTVVAPSRPSSENVDPSPQKSISDDDAGSSNSTESLSAAQLKTNLDVAGALEATAKDEFDKATKALEGKQQAALDANQQLTEKKQKWEELDGIAKEKEKDWKALEGAARKAEKEYTKATDRLDKAKRELPKEQLLLDAYPQKIVDAKAAHELVKERPTRLATLEAARKAKVDGKAALEASVQPAGILTTEEERLRELWESADSLSKGAQLKFDTNKCEKPENQLTCRSIVADRDRFKGAADIARGKHESANTALETAENEVANFDMDLEAMDGDIATLKTDSAQPKYDRDVEIAGEAVTALESAEKTQKGKVDSWTKEKGLAALDEPLKARARKEAAEKVVGGKPAEVDAARGAATDAFFETDDADKAKIAKDKEVTEAQNALTKAESSYKEAQAVVARLTDRYDVQKRKEDEAQRKRSLAAILGGIGGAVALLIIAGIVGYLVWRKKRDPKGKYDKVSNGADDNQTAVSVQSKSKKGNKTKKGKKKNAKSAVTTPGADTSNVSTSVTQPSRTPSTTTQSPNVQQNETPPTPGQLPKEDVFIPGEQPYKIPAKHFKWCGPLKRKSRWHGAPIHDFEGVEGVKKVDKIVFDPSACTATEIGQNEIIEDAGPASDSSRSEFLSNLDEWERGHKIYMAEKAAEKEGKKTPNSKGSKGSKDGKDSKPPTPASASATPAVSSSKATETPEEEQPLLSTPQKEDTKKGGKKGGSGASGSEKSADEKAKLLPGKDASTKKKKNK